MKYYTEHFGRCSAHSQKLQNKEKSEKCEINCRPSVRPQWDAQYKIGDTPTHIRTENCLFKGGYTE